MKQNKLEKLRNYIVFLLLLVCIPFMDANAAWKEYEADYSNGKETKRLHCEMWVDGGGSYYSEEIGYSCYSISEDGSPSVTLGGTSITTDYLKNGVISAFNIGTDGWADLEGGFKVVNGTIDGKSTFQPISCYYQDNSGKELTINLTEDGIITSSDSNLLSRKQTGNGTLGIGYLYTNYLSKNSCPNVLMIGKSSFWKTDTFKFGDNVDTVKKELKENTYTTYTLNGSKTTETLETENIEAKSNLNTCILEEVINKDTSTDIDSNTCLELDGSYDLDCIERNYEINYKKVCAEQVQKVEDTKKALDNYKESSGENGEDDGKTFGGVTCDTLSEVTAFAGKLYRYGMVALFVLMVILTMSDFAKATISGKNEDEIKKAGKHVTKRIIILAIYVFLPLLITFVVGKVLGMEACLDF